MDEPQHYAFLHGGAQGGWVWEQTIDALAAQTGGRFGPALALDAPGCGTKRGRVTDGLGIEDVARELVADIEAAGLSDVVLVGHSQAGQAMTFMVEQRPHLFRRLVHVSCSIPLPGQTVLEMMGTSVQGANTDEVGWPTQAKADRVHARAAERFCTDMSADETAAFLARLGKDMWPLATYSETGWRTEHLAQVPATYVVCLQDGILPVSWQELFAARFHCGRIVRLDCGHQAMTTRPHALAEIIRHEL